MSYILVATDFTTASDNAVHYAADLAASLNVPLQIVHTFVAIPVMYNTDMPIPITPVAEIRSEGQEQMNKLEEKMKPAYPQLAISYSLSYGSDADGLEEAIEKQRPLLAVIGYETDEQLWTGDEAPATMKDLSVPVLAVPHGAAWQRPQHVCVACDGAMLEHAFPLAELQEITQSKNIVITLLHVSIDNTARETWNYEGSKLHQSLADADVQFHVATSGDTDESIARFTETNEADWLVIMPHHHGFFAGLFHRSHTKALLHRLRIPVLALHGV